MPSTDRLGTGSHGVRYGMSGSRPDDRSGTIGLAIVGTVPGGSIDTLGGARMTIVDRSALMARYAMGADAVAAAVRGATEEDLDRRPPSGAWTARQIVHHVADSETMASIRLRRLMAESDPVIAGYDEPEWARRLHYDRPIATSLAAIAAVRAASLELLRTLTPDEWGLAGTHSDSGPYSVDDWLRIYTEHSHDHAEQIIRAIRGED